MEHVFKRRPTKERDIEKERDNEKERERDCCVHIPVNMLHNVPFADITQPTVHSFYRPAAYNDVSPCAVVTAYRLSENNVSPCYNDVSPAYHNVSPAYSNASSFFNNMSCGYRNVSPVCNNVSPGCRIVSPG